MAIDFLQLKELDNNTSNSNCETEQVVGFHEIAKHYLLKYEWCDNIEKTWIAFYKEDFLGVFLFKILSKREDVDDFVWVVSGEVPPVYIDILAAEDYKEVLNVYYQELEEWVYGVYEDQLSDESVYIDLPQTKLCADILISILKVIDEDIFAKPFEYEVPRSYQKGLYNLFAKSWNFLDKLNLDCEGKYKISSYDRWEYDQKLGLLLLYYKEYSLEIDFQYVGSYCPNTMSWKWSWDNDYILQNVKNKIFRVKIFGEKNNVSELSLGSWNAEQWDGLLMSAISAYILNAKGVQMFFSKGLYVFFIFQNIRKKDASP